VRCIRVGWGGLAAVRCQQSFGWLLWGFLLGCFFLGLGSWGKERDDCRDDPEQVPLQGLPVCPSWGWAELWRTWPLAWAAEPSPQQPHKPHAAPSVSWERGLTAFPSISQGKKKRRTREKQQDSNSGKCVRLGGCPLRSAQRGSPEAVVVFCHVCFHSPELN